MSSEPVRKCCPPTCPKVREQLRAALAEAPWLAHGIFPRKKKDVDVRLPPDVPRDVPDALEPVIEAVDVRVNHDEKIETDVSLREVEDVVEARPIQEERIVEELAELVEEQQPVIPTEEITDRDLERIDLIEKEEPAIIEEPIERITIDDDHVKKVDLIEERELIREPTIVPEQPSVLTEGTTEREVEKVDLDKELIGETVIREEMADEKIDLVEDVELTREPISIEEQPVTPIEKIVDRDIKKIDLLEEGIFPEKVEPAKELAVTDEELEIIVDEVDQAAPAEIAPERPEEYFEPRRIEDYDAKEEEEEEEVLTDYERFIDEEMEESLPGVTAKEIPEQPEIVRRKIPEEPAVSRERDDRERPVGPKEAREIDGPAAREEAREEPVISPSAERVVPSKRAPGVVKDACDETCPLAKEQKERIIRKLRERQEVVDHYYLTKGFSYFEDVCTCSLACMVYSLGRDPFVRSIFASLTLFAIGLKLCSELDAWEMPSRVS